jgi:hypothetical protein
MSSSQEAVVLQASHDGRTFKIEEDANAGFYLYAFEGGKCTHDYLQDTLALAKKFARDDSAFRRTLGMASTPAA